MFCLHSSYKKIVEFKNDQKENLKMIKNTLPNKSQNPESLKNKSKQFEKALELMCI